MYFFEGLHSQKSAYFFRFAADTSFLQALNRKETSYTYFTLWGISVINLI